MPTGVALRDPREQLFAAAERVLLREGASGLTSRAVTDEAGVSKGVMHRHFPDFDAFLTELVLDHASQLETQTTALRESVGTGTVVDNLAAVLVSLFSPVTVAIIPLITFHDQLRSRLRRAAPGGGIAILAQATAAISDYLARERDLGRIAADTDIDSLSLSLVGGGHLLSAENASRSLPDAATLSLVTAVLANSAGQRPS